MRRFQLAVVLVSAVIATVVLLEAQGTPERMTLPFSDPSRPGTIRMRLTQASITVKGSNVKEVTITAHRRQDNSRERRRGEQTGLRRLGQPAGLTVEEENNVMSIGARQFDDTEIALEVPTATNLRLFTVNGGDISVDSVEGEIEVSNVNGSIALTDVAGSIVANTTNGDVRVSIRQVTEQKPMSFTSLNGDVDVTLPPAVKANLKLRSDQGEVFTDFDVQIEPTAPAVDAQPSSRPGNGRYRFRPDASIYGKVNGGGPEFELRTLNGDVFLRRRK